MTSWRTIGQAVVPFTAVLIFGVLYFGAHRHGIVQTNPSQFQPAIYTLELMIPVVNLAQRSNWSAQHGAQAVATILVLSGWVLVTVILAALTGLVRRAD
jgi:hypothetical protein